MRLGVSDQGRDIGCGEERIRKHLWRGKAWWGERQQRRYEIGLTGEFLSIQRTERSARDVSLAATCCRVYCPGLRLYSIRMLTSKLGFWLSFGIRDAVTTAISRLNPRAIQAWISRLQTEDIGKICLLRDGTSRQEALCTSLRAA